jgi:hypothetical protein
LWVRRGNGLPEEAVSSDGAAAFWKDITPLGQDTQQGGDFAGKEGEVEGEGEIESEGEDEGELSSSRGRDRASDSELLIKHRACGLFSIITRTN